MNIKSFTWGQAFVINALMSWNHSNFPKGYLIQKHNSEVTLLLDNWEFSLRKFYYTIFRLSHLPLTLKNKYRKELMQAACFFYREKIRITYPITLSDIYFSANPFSEDSSILIIPKNDWYYDIDDNQPDIPNNNQPDISHRNNNQPDISHRNNNHLDLIYCQEIIDFFNLSESEIPPVIATPKLIYRQKRFLAQEEDFFIHHLKLIIKTFPDDNLELLRLWVHLYYDTKSLIAQESEILITQKPEILITQKPEIFAFTCFVISEELIKPKSERQSYNVIPFKDRELGYLHFINYYWSIINLTKGHLYPSDNSVFEVCYEHNKDFFTLINKLDSNITIGQYFTSILDI